MKWNNIKNINLNGAHFANLYPDNASYTLDDNNIAKIDLDQDFELYFQNSDASYTVVIAVENSNGSGEFTFNSSIDGINWGPIKLSDGTTDLTISQTTDDSWQIIQLVVDQAYNKITFTNTDNTAGTAYVNIKGV